MSFFVHPNAIIESNNIGKNTRLWAFVHILPRAVIGEDCNICDHVFIENDVVVGDRVTIKCGVQLWDGITLEDDVFIGPNVSFTNDLFPRSKQYLEKFLPTIVHRGASIGANATILPGLEIGRGAMIGAGAVVTRTVPPHAIVVGNPARIIGYEPTPASSHGIVMDEKSTTLPLELGVSGVKVVSLPFIQDLRGNLSFAQVQDQLPFVPQRYFLVFDVSNTEIRGEHAHHTLQQFLVCVKGSCMVMVDNGRQRAELALNRPDLGIYIPPMVWAAQYKYTTEAVLLVLASDIYRPEDYIRDYEQFLAMVISR
jgi:UDP-2-acetamido-3-amino-2,3-dideoxy-glucuronate N-acetyltransferase